MAIIKTDAGVSRFLLQDYQTSSFDGDSVTFKYYSDWADEHGGGETTITVTFTGDLEMVDGVVSGFLSGATYHYHQIDYDPSHDPVTNETSEMTIDGQVWVADLAALQKSGNKGVEMLLAGDDDITGPIAEGFAGNDTFRSPSGTIDGGSGVDTVTFNLSRKAITLDLIKNSDQVFISIEHFYGSRYGDMMRGGNGTDRLHGWRGDDLLVGRWGDDQLFGDLGDDRLIGGPGRDKLAGGQGDDSFVFEKIAESRRGNYDLIGDFSRGEDIIDLHKIDANVERAGNQTFKFIGSHFFSGHAGELRTYVSGSVTHVIADVDGDRNADFDVGLKGHYKLTSLDFDL